MIHNGLGLLGRKVGMTRIFTEDGESIPVTVLDVSNNRVTQIKTPEADGYAAVQVTYGTRRASRVAKAQAGHLAKAGVEAGSFTKEFRMDAEALSQLSAGSNVSVEIFEVGQKVDVSGVTIGKGYAGTIKRYNFSSGRASHGNSRSHNVPGSIGMAQDPGRVFPGKRMTGHMGDVNRTVQNLEIARVDAERGLLLVKGAVPGSKNGNIIVRTNRDGAIVRLRDVAGGELAVEVVDLGVGNGELLRFAGGADSVGIALLLGSGTDSNDLGLKIGDELFEPLAFRLGDGTEGLRLHRAGQYDDAIARFAAVQSPPSLRVQALKHTAFGYCVTNRLPLCQRAFQDALALSPAFRLTKAEQGHPVWGPVFTKALQQSQPARRR